MPTTFLRRRANVVSIAFVTTLRCMVGCHGTVAGNAAYQSLEQRAELIAYSDATRIAVLFELLADVVPKFLRHDRLMFTSEPCSKPLCSVRGLYSFVENQAKRLPADTVRPKPAAIERTDRIDVQAFRQQHQRSIRKVHGRVLVLRHQLGGFCQALDRYALVYFGL